MPPVVCRHFLAGFCRNGEECAFAHITPRSPQVPSHRYSSSPNARVFPVGTTATSNTTWSAETPRICRFYLMGHCAYGAGCRFLHPRNKDDSLKSPPNWINYQNDESNTRSDRFHFRKADSVGSTPLSGFSFKQTYESLQAKDPVPVAPQTLESFGYKHEEVYSAKESLSRDDLQAYSELDDDFSTIPLLPPPLEYCT
uniref:Nucleoporin NUP42 n=1 Tax=Mesocestoides corti TaxID=53468 RepID=A0A5K3EU85_MESCO